MNGTIYGPGFLRQVSLVTSLPVMARYQKVLMIMRWYWPQRNTPVKRLMDLAAIDTPSVARKWSH